MSRKSCTLFFVTLLLLAFMGLPDSQASDRYRYEGIVKEFKNELNVQAGNLPDANKTDLWGGKPVSLSDAVRTSLVRNPDTNMAMARIRQAETQIALANAAFLPTFKVYGEYLHGDAPSAYLFKTIDQRQFAPGTDFNYPGTFDNYETGAVAGINIYNRGQDKIRQHLAKSSLAQSVQQRKGIQNAIISSVISTYYDALASEEYILISQKSERTVEKQLRVMRVKFENGGILKSDLLSLEVRLAETKEGVVTSINRHKRFLTALTALMGYNPMEPVSITGAKESLPAIPQSCAEAITLSIKKRPELAGARERVRQAKMKLDMAGSQYLPRVDLNGRYYLDDDNFKFNANRQNWTVGLVVNWELFSGLSTRAVKDKATADLLEALWLDKKTIISITEEVKTAYLKLDETKERLKVAEKSVDLAEESLNLVKIRFEGGSATITRYLEAELARFRAAVYKTSAFYDREKAIAEIARATSILENYFNKTDTQTE